MGTPKKHLALHLASAVCLIPSPMLSTTHMGFISLRACPSKPPKPPCLSPSAPSLQPPNPPARAQSRHMSWGDRGLEGRDRLSSCLGQFPSTTDDKQLGWRQKQASLPFQKKAINCKPLLLRYLQTARTASSLACSTAFPHGGGRPFLAGNLQGPTANTSVRAFHA